MLGTGGGGDPYLGTLAAVQAVRERGPIPLLSVDEIGDDALIVFPALIGSPIPGVEKFPMRYEPVRAAEMLGQFLGGPITAVMPIEIGGINSVIPMTVAADLGLPVLDGDCMGRAFPEVQLVTLTLHGISASPLAIVDERGNGAVLSAIDNHWMERFARSVCIDMGAIAAAVGYPISGRQAKAATIPGTLTLAESIGRAIREARAAKTDALAAVQRVTGGVRLFAGKIVDVQRWVQAGFAKGETVLEGLEADRGRRMVVRFQNENLVAIRDGEIVASVPDLITIMVPETGEPITTEALRYGFRVAVIGMPCHAQWRTPEGLALAGPRYFGYDIDFVPVEQRFGSVAVA